MSQPIFLSYRRDDASSDAQLISAALRNALGDDAVFMDISSIELGAVWPEELQKALQAAETVVAVIGPEWLRAGTDEWGRRRIDRDDDWVRQELALALKDKEVIPVLVRGARIPPPEALPEPLKALSKMQGIEIRRDYVAHDVKLLLEKFGQPSKGAAQPSKDAGLFFTRIDIQEGTTHWQCDNSSPGPLLKVEEAGDEDDELARIMHNRYYSAVYLNRSTRYFKLWGRFEPDPNPVLDIIVNTGRGSSQLLLACGIEVIAAQRRIITAGSARKITLDPSDKYRVPFPIPARVRNPAPEDGEPSTFKLEAGQYGGDQTLYFGDVQLSEWEWADTPVSSMQEMRDPVYIEPDTPYRFALEIEESHRMPTDTLLQLVIKTNHDTFRSDAIYFVKP